MACVPYGQSLELRFGDGFRGRLWETQERRLNSIHLDPLAAATRKNFLRQRQRIQAPGHFAGSLISIWVNHLPPSPSRVIRRAFEGHSL